MTPAELTQDLKRVTESLAATIDGELSGLQPLLQRRFEIVTAIAAADPADFTAADLIGLHTALAQGEPLFEALTLHRRAIILEWQRLNHVRPSARITPPPSRVAISA